MATGRIKRLMREKGYGFIRGAETNGKKEIFFHRSAMRGTAFEDLNEGDAVFYEEGEPTDKGPRAATVERG